MLQILRADIFCFSAGLAEKGEDPANAECTFPPAHMDAHIVLKGRTCKQWISGQQSQH